MSKITFNINVGPIGDIEIIENYNYRHKTFDLVLFLMLYKLSKEICHLWYYFNLN